MIIAKVLSRVVSTARLDTLPARQLLSVEPLTGFGDRTPLVAIDGVQAGPGDIVLVLQEGTGARQVVLDDPGQPLPAQAVIVGIVDAIQGEVASGSA
jgi:microcompartment protein CcmK/EutM